MEWRTVWGAWAGVAMLAAVAAAAEPPSPQSLLDREKFWDNRDWDWYQANIPFFDCPDADLQTTYYYRWELLTKHLTYGSADSGYSFTEFIDRPFWSGAYGAISCPAGHQLYEARWLRDPQYAWDYAAYWHRAPGAQPRNYSTWLADATWAVHQAHPDKAALRGLLPDLVRNYEGWERRHFVAEVGLFWQTGHDDGMEFNINSRQTPDILRGAPAYRPTLNAYLWADALAIARVADLAGDKHLADEYRRKAAALKENLQKKLWDPQRQFFFPLSQRDESADGFTVKALTWTHQTGRHAGSPFGRELIGYVPWQFRMPDPGREAGWRWLGDPQGFAAKFGPTTVERRDPMFLLKPSCCWWSGQSWPYATSQTLKAMANLLQYYDQKEIAAADYVALLRTFAKTHRKDGRPYLAEACHPDTGSFAGHDGYNHSEHYFHSSFNDLIVTGLAGLECRDDDRIAVRPLAPADWPYFSLTGIPYRGRIVSIVWDRDGARYGRGVGLRLFADGQLVASAPALGPLAGNLPPAKPPKPRSAAVNFAVNNDGRYFPRLNSSFAAEKQSLSKLADGNYWYHRDPPNRWTFAGTPNAADALTVDFGIPRPVHTVKLYLLDDGEGIVPPKSFAVEWHDGQQWRPLPETSRTPANPSGRRANVVRCTPVSARKLRVEFRHGEGGKTGLSELEAWGDSPRPIPPAPAPAGNLAAAKPGAEFPKASASASDRFGGKAELAIDGIANFLPTPLNRWTSYESPNAEDWLAIDFGRPTEFRRVEAAVYDDGGGVQAPAAIRIEVWDGAGWRAVPSVVAAKRPAGGQWNEFRFPPQSASKLRLVFRHAGPARSGVSEVLVWND